MNIKVITSNNLKIAMASCDDNEKLIYDVQSALDLIMTVKYESQAENIIIDKALVDDKFFVLSSGFAGEILQKFINYKVNVAFVGDYSKYTSKPLKDFIYESNKGKNVFFINDTQIAIEKLSQQN